jgi:hypothetical protein
MATRKRSPHQGIATRHARACPAGDGGDCDCTPTYQAQVWDAGAKQRITETFSTITAARRWRQDAYAALRAGTLTADRGPTLEEAADDWLEAARAGIVALGRALQAVSDPWLRTESRQAGAPCAWPPARDHTAAAAAVR